jgi:hypothetical protein
MVFFCIALGSSDSANSEINGAMTEAPAEAFNMCVELIT